MLSSNTLFHFTKTRHALLSILEHDFWPNFCLETAPFEDENGPLQNGTPMVCFCDIPLASATEHMGHYGNYALGLTKQWGIDNGITPVLYTHAASPMSLGLRRLMDQGLQIGRGPINRLLWAEVYRLMAFTKPYAERRIEDGQERERRFYDEREWRWVPQDLPDEIASIDASQFIDGKPDPQVSAMLHARSRLHFGPDDIRYIVVASDDEILPTVAEILRIKERFSRETRTLLTTRVISAEQIREDF